MRLGYDNWIDIIPETGVAPSITATDASSTTAADATNIGYLRNPGREQCELSGSSPFTFRGHWGGEQRKVGVFAMSRHTLASGTFRLKLFTDQAWTMGLHDSMAQTINPALPLSGFLWGMDPGSSLNTDRLQAESPLVYWLPSQYSNVKSWELTITSTATRKMISRIRLGPYYEFARSPSLGSDIIFVDNSTVERVGGGSAIGDKGSRWKRAKIVCDWMTPDEQHLMLDFMAANVGRDVLLSVFPGDSDSRLERDYTLIGRMRLDSSIAYARLDARSTVMVVEEN